MVQNYILWKVMVGSVKFVRCTMVNFKGLAKKEHILYFPILYAIYNGCNCVVCYWQQPGQAKVKWNMYCMRPIWFQNQLRLSEKFASLMLVCTDHSCCSLLLHPWNCVFSLQTICSRKLIRISFGIEISIEYSCQDNIQNMAKWVRIWSCKCCCSV
jgi:hypothetical protein